MDPRWLPARSPPGPREVPGRWVLGGPGAFRRLKMGSKPPEDDQEPFSRRLKLAKMSPKRHLRTHQMPEEASKVTQETFKMAQVAPEKSPDRLRETKFIAKTIVFL